jgi:hypothetical protein
VPRRPGKPADIAKMTAETPDVAFNGYADQHKGEPDHGPPR